MRSQPRIFAQLKNKKLLFGLVFLLVLTSVLGGLIVPRLLKGPVLPVTSSKAAESESPQQKPWDGTVPVQLVKWSDPSSWNGKLPVAGASVVIPAGQVIQLDVSPPPLANLTIEGTLLVAEKDLELQAGWIMVHGQGKFLAGSEAEPFQHRLTITLTGNNVDEDVMSMGSKFLGVMGGTLELHGQRRTSWLRLGSTAEAGATQITLEKPVEWQPGDRIVISSTDYESSQAEEVTIKAVDGANVTLEQALKYMHWGQKMTYAGQELDERAEVGLLSHNIVVQGDESSLETGFGGHSMFMGKSAVRIENVEFHRMGQQGRIARYPVHWHLMGDASGAYIKTSSINHSFNRCVTIHGSNKLLVQGNVAYDTIGHCYFLEDGIEVENVLENNLGLLTRKPQDGAGVLPSDRRAATFWITNPNNVVRGNVAGGSEGMGFWYALPEHPTGLSESAENNAAVWPRYTPLNVFSDNVAHSNEDTGLHVDDGPNSDGSTAGFYYEPREGYSNSSPIIPAEFKNFTVYKHRFLGIWMRGTGLRLVGAKMADNAEGVIFAARETFMQDSLMVGESENKGNPAPGEQRGLDGRSLPRPWAPETRLGGFCFYDGRIGVERVTFVNFQSNSQRPAGALAYFRDNGNPINVRNFAQELTFVNANPVYLEDPHSERDGDKASLILDADGSLTGKAGQYVVANFPLLANSACSFKQEWNTYICPNRYISFSIASQGGSVAPVTLRRSDGAEGTLAGMGDTYAAISAPINQAYTFKFAGASPSGFQLDFQDMQAGEWMGVAIPYSGNFTVYRDAERNRPITAAQSMDEFNRSTGDKYYYERPTGLLHLKAVPRDGLDWSRINVAAA